MPRSADPSGLLADLSEPRVVGPGFYQRVYDVVRLVPAGHVTTYSDVGTILGSPRVARQVGFALAGLPDDTDVPWQRVINARGMVSYRGDLGRASLQEALLKSEGIVVDKDGKLDLATYRWSYPGITVPYDGAR